MTALEIPRDRYKRPLIIPPGGGKPTAYSRPSKWGEILEDSYGLDLWHQQRTAVGIAENQWLIQKVLAAKGDWTTLKGLCATAMDKAGANEKSQYGTFVHKLTEKIDRNEDLGDYPLAVEDDLIAYEALTRDIEHTHIEAFMVCEDIKAAGTPDRLSRFRGGYYVFDVKTGKLSPTKWAVQLAIYANSVFYAELEGQSYWRGAPDELSLTRALVAHVPAEQGTADLYWLDIEAGWEAVTEHAIWVKEWRKRKDLLTLVDPK